MRLGILSSNRPLLPPDAPAEGVLVCLLGSFRILRRGQPLNVLISGKAMALLAELALRLDIGVPREELIETLWPEQDAAHATVSLNSLVYSLHRQLRGPVHGAAALVYANGHYALNQAAGISTDIAQFDALVGTGNRLVAAGDEPAATDTYQRAVDVYRGDLCAGTNVHAVIERERLRASFLTVLAWLAARYYRRHEDASALSYALRLLAFEPCREDAHRMVMRIRVRQGERAQALRQYRVCEQILRREFDVAPEASTRELFEQIRAGKALP
jgi:DNA-binding SARP family transcriptional activator